MAFMNAFDATKLIREIEKVSGALCDIDPPHSHVPVVALTAHALVEVRERCLESGMDDFLVKPYDEQQMIDMLGRWLAPREAPSPRDETPAIATAGPAPAAGSDAT